MADKTVDEVAKLRLKLVRQEERNRLRRSYQQTSHGSLQGNSTNPQKSNNSNDVLALVLAQSVQLQSLMFKQLNSSQTDQPPQISRPTETEVDQVAYREMTPFITHRKPTEKVSATFVPSVPRKPTSVRARRMVSTPIRPSDYELPWQPRPRAYTPSVTGFLHEPFLQERVSNNYPFPGTKGIKKLRHVFIAAWFCFILISLLKKLTKKRLEITQRLDECLKASISELHQTYYLKKDDNSIWTVLENLVKEGCLNYKVNQPGIFQKLSQQEQSTLKGLSLMVESVVNHVTEIQPAQGLLSSTKEGVVWFMLQSDVLLPTDYLWQCEMDIVQLSSQGSLGEDKTTCGLVLVIGLFVSRGLVSSILLQPEQTELCPETPTPVAKSNLKVLASILMKIVRGISVTGNSKPMQIPSEIGDKIFSDEEMKYLFKKLDGTVTLAKDNLFKWASGYIDRVQKEL